MHIRIMFFKKEIYSLGLEKGPPCVSQLNKVKITFWCRSCLDNAHYPKRRFSVSFSPPIYFQKGEFSDKQNLDFSVFKSINKGQLCPRKLLFSVEETTTAAERFFMFACLFV